MMIDKSINDIIAARLTDLYVEEKELPRKVTIWSEDADYYRFIIYKPETHAFYFAGWMGDDDETAYIGIEGCSPIDFPRAVREVWNRLGESERIQLMAEVLGARDAK